MTIRTHDQIKPLQYLLDTLEQARIADDLLSEILFNYNYPGCAQEIHLETYRKLQNYFNINEDE